MTEMTIARTEGREVAGTTLDPAKVAELIRTFLESKSPKTVRAYSGDLREFARFVGVETVEDAARVLFRHGLGEANLLALRYKNDLLARGLAAATINRRLAALRSFAALARRIGLVGWKVEIEGVPVEDAEDRRGPLDVEYATILDTLARRRGPKAIRDRAIVRLLHDLALRRGEVASLDVEDVLDETDGVSILVRGKGRRQKARLTLPDPTKDALWTWLDERGSEPGALFTNLSRDPAVRGARLGGDAINLLVRRLGQDSGIERRLRAHGLRHLAITRALDLTDGNVRRVAAFSRHRDVRMVMKYDDRRKNDGAAIARLVAGA